MTLSTTAVPATQKLALARAVLTGSRAGRGKILVDDLENIDRALRSGVDVLRVYHTPSAEAEVPAGSPVADVPHVAISAREARDLFGTERSSRVFAIARRPRPARLADLADRPGDVLVLDGVRLAGNVGAVVRTAAGMGASGVVLLDSGLTTTTDRRLIRASRGFVFALPVVLAGRRELVELCAALRLPLLVTAADARTPVQDLAGLDGRVAIALGSERRGCSRELLDHATGSLAIRTTPQVESLNLSVAAGIALYCRQPYNLGSRDTPRA